MLDGKVLKEIEGAAGKGGRSVAPLAGMTSFGSGGPAAFMIEAESSGQLSEILLVSRRHGLDWFVIGKGTNLLVDDQGFDGVVIRLSGELKQCILQPPLLVCGAGVTLSAAANTAAKKGLSGMEPLAHIPGTLGGAVAMNAGAFGAQIGDLVEQVEACGPGECRRLGRDNLEFGYRSSVLPAGSVVTKVSLKLTPGDPEEIHETTRAYLRKRKTRHLLGQKTFGSVFKNPSSDQTAGGLLERAGCKNLSVGDAAVSAAHANFIINKGSAATADVIDLMNQCRRRVHDKFGVDLEPEVRFLGGAGLKHF